MTTILAPTGTNFGSIGPNFGTSNVDNIPSSGGMQGYTSNFVISAPTPTRYYPQTDGSYSISPPNVSGSTTTGVNPTQSGDLYFQSLLNAYANQFGGSTDASTSGGPVVVVPPSGTTDSGSSNQSSIVILLVLAAVGFLGYRWYKSRSK